MSGITGDFDEAFAAAQKKLESATAGKQFKSTWSKVDLTEYLDPNYVPVQPTMLQRSDGVFLLYPGKSHSIYGESESGKSWIAMYETVQLINAGHNVLYLDFEDTPQCVVERLLALGATHRAIKDHLDYRRPENAPGFSDTDEWNDILHTEYAMIVVDGVTQALSYFGKKSDDNGDVTSWMSGFVNKLADTTGAAVVLIDHVTKSHDGRGRFAIGAQAKLSTLTGAAYSVDVKDICGKGRKGRLTLRVTKDRPGTVRGYCGTADSNRTQIAASVVIDGTDPKHVKITLWEPNLTDAVDDTVPARPVALMEKASRILEGSEPMSRNAIHTRMMGRKEFNMAAIETLVSEGYFEATSSRAYAPLKSVRPYRMPRSGSDTAML